MLDPILKEKSIRTIKVFHPKLRLYQNELIFCMIKLRCCTVFCQKIWNFYRPDFFLQNDENVAFSQFRSVHEKLYFIT